MEQMKNILVLICMGGFAFLSVACLINSIIASVMEYKRIKKEAPNEEERLQRERERAQREEEYHIARMEKLDR